MKACRSVPLAFRCWTRTRSSGRSHRANFRVNPLRAAWPNDSLPRSLTTRIIVGRVATFRTGKASVWFLAKRAKVEMRVVLRLLRNDVVLRFHGEKSFLTLRGRALRRRIATGRRYRDRSRDVAKIAKDAQRDRDADDLVPRSLPVFSRCAWPDRPVHIGERKRAFVAHDRPGGPYRAQDFQTTPSRPLIVESQIAPIFPAH